MFQENIEIQALQTARRGGKLEPVTTGASCGSIFGGISNIFCYEDREECG